MARQFIFDSNNDTTYLKIEKKFNKSSKNFSFYSTWIRCFLKDTSIFFRILLLLEFFIVTYLKIHGFGIYFRSNISNNFWEVSEWLNKQLR